MAKNGKEHFLQHRSIDRQDGSVFCPVSSGGTSSRARLGRRRGSDVLMLMNADY